MFVVFSFGLANHSHCLPVVGHDGIRFFRDRDSGAMLGTALSVGFFSGK